MPFGDRVSIVFFQQKHRNSGSINWQIYQKSNFFFIYLFNFITIILSLLLLLLLLLFHTECMLWEPKSLRLFCNGRHLHIHNEITYDILLSTQSQNLKYTCMQIQNVLYIIRQPTFSLINYIWRLIALGLTVFPYVLSFLNAIAAHNAEDCFL